MSLSSILCAALGWVYTRFMDRCCQKYSFMAITIHYIDETFKLHAHTLHVKPVGEASYTALMILQKFKDGLAVFEVSINVDDHIYVISDSGSNCCAEDSILLQFSLENTEKQNYSTNGEFNMLPW
jgi:hypothetical protein